jgi:hypothetical protein
MVIIYFQGHLIESISMSSLPVRPRQGLHLQQGLLPTQATPPPGVTLHRSASAHRLSGPAELIRPAALENPSDSGSPQVSRSPNRLPVISPTTPVPVRGNLVLAPSIASIDLGQNLSRHAVSTSATPYVDPAISLQRKIRDAQVKLKEHQERMASLQMLLPPGVNHVDELVALNEFNYDLHESDYYAVRMERHAIQIHPEASAYDKEMNRLNREIGLISGKLNVVHNHCLGYPGSPYQELVREYSGKKRILESELAHLRSDLEEFRAKSTVLLPDLECDENYLTKLVDYYLGGYMNALALKDAINLHQKAIDQIKKDIAKLQASLRDPSPKTPAPESPESPEPLQFELELDDHTTQARN